MNLVGTFLKDKRTERKISLEEAADELKISFNVLQDIENDTFPEYIDKIFLIGHIRAYAKYLKLNEKELIENFKIQTSYEKNNDIHQVSKPVKSINIFSFSKFVSIPSIFIISFGFYFLFIKNNDLQPEYSMFPDLPE